MKMRLPQANSFSITESYNPRFRKGQQKHLHSISFQEVLISEGATQKYNSVEPLLGTIFSHLNQTIGNLEEMFRTRMHVHEQQILRIAHSQIKKMQAESAKVVQRYSALIQERSISSELLDLKYEVLYFQKRACEYFKENNKLRDQIKQLQEQILSLKIGEQSDRQALNNISRKYLKEKTLKQKLLLSHLQNTNDIETSNRRLKMLTDVEKVYEVTTTKVKKEKNDPLLPYFSQSKTLQKPRKTNIKLNSLKHKHNLSTEP